MTSTTNVCVNNVNIQEYDGVLNIDVFNKEINNTLPNNMSCCGDEPIKSTVPSNRIKLEYFNIDRNDEKHVLESGGECRTSLFLNSNSELASINKNNEEINTTKQSPDKSERIGFPDSMKIDQSKLTLQCQSKLMISKRNKVRDTTIRVDVRSELDDSSETDKKAMENRKTCGKYTDCQVRKSKYIQMIENHAYLDKFDREMKRNGSKDMHFVGIMNPNERSQKTSKKNVSRHGIKLLKTNFNPIQERMKIPVESSNSLARASGKSGRGDGKPFRTRKLPKNIRINDGKCNLKVYGNCSHFPEYSQAMSYIDEKQSEQNNSNQKKHHMIKSSINSSISESNVSKNFKLSQNEGSSSLEQEKTQISGKRGEGDNNSAPDSNNLGVRILWPLEKSIYCSTKPKSMQSSRSFKDQKQSLREKLENLPKNQHSVKREQLYYNFLMPENNFIEKCFVGNSQGGNPPSIQPPIIENEQSRDTNIWRQTNSPDANADSPENTTRVEFMSVHKKKNRTRNSKSKSSHRSKLEKRKVFPGNIVEMREDETPCEYLNQFSSILIDNLKDPIPKDPLNLPSACNVYVPKRKRPIPLERYAEHYISTTTGTVTCSSNVTITTSTLSEATSNSNGQSVSTSKSLIILKKISQLTKVSVDKDKNVKNSNENPINKRNNIKHLHRQSDQSFEEKPCCCFIQ